MEADIQSQSRSSSSSKTKDTVCWYATCRLDGIGDTPSLVPFDFAVEILDLLQLVAQLDDGEVDHTWVKAESSADGLLNGARGIEAHDEVVALAVSGLMLGGDLGQAEGTPVGVAANDAAGADDLDTGVTSNSVHEISRRSRSDGMLTLSLVVEHTREPR